MDVAGVEINVRGTHAELLLERRQFSVDATRDLSARVDALRVLLAIQQQNLAFVVIRHTIDRPLGGKRAAHIIALPQQPLCQDRLADLPILLPVVRQSRPLT